MKFTAGILLFFISLNLLTPITSQCTRGCSDCVNGHCTGYCLQRRKYDFMFCERKLAPEENQCLLYGDIGCFLCNPGFANVGSGEKCEKYEPMISKCLGATKDQSGTVKCFLCDGGFPSTTGLNCDDFGSIGPGKNCLLGMRKNGNIECFRCKEGFVNQGGGCIAQVIQGCRQVNILKNKCVSCDVIGNWHMTKFEGICTKYGEAGK